MSERKVFPFLQRIRERIRERLFGTSISETEHVYDVDVDQPFSNIIDKLGKIEIEINSRDAFQITKGEPEDTYYILVRDGEIKLMIDGNEVGNLREDNLELYITPTKNVDIKVNGGNSITISTFGRVRESKRIMKIFAKEGETDISKMQKAKIYKLSIKVEEVKTLTKPFEEERKETTPEVTPKVEFKVEVKPEVESGKKESTEEVKKEEKRCECRE